MADTWMQELEQASRIVLAPPNLVTSEQRHAAENVILDFRKKKMPYSVCRFILENSSVDYVLFQAATTIKEAVVREWSLLNGDDIESLRSFLVRFVTRNVTLQSYVREQILQTVAVILKCGTLDASGTSCDCLFQDVTELIGSGNVTMQLVACSMLSALLNEYSSSVRTSTVGFTWDFHIKCKQTFEQNNLKRVFSFSLQVLDEIETAADPLSREVTAVLNRVLSIAEQVLSWEFTPRSVHHRNHSSFTSNGQSVSLRPSETWRDVLLSDATLPLFFRIHKKVRYNTEMAQHSLICLSQLASLNGLIFSDDKARIRYLTMFIDGFLKLLSDIELHVYEKLGIALTFRNMMMMFPLRCFAALPETLLQTVLTYLAGLTCSMGQSAAQEEGCESGDGLHMEAYEKLLDTWLSLVADTDHLAPSTLQPHAIQIFNAYMTCHLGVPYGSRPKNVLSEDDIVELEEDDREKFTDQLCCVGALARVVPAETLPLMASVLDDLVKRYHGHLHQMQQKREARKSESPEDMSTLNSLQEDLHWTLLVTAHILTEGTDGETPLIPANVMEYSIVQASSMSLQLTLQLLMSPSQPCGTSSDRQASADKVICLISSVLHLCEVETWAVDAKLSFCLSPQVTATAMWVLTRWAAAYLLPNENYYAQMSETFSAAFGQDSESGRWIVDFLLQKIAFNLQIWNGEPQVMADSLQLFVTMVDNKTRAQFVSESPHVMRLAQLSADKRGAVGLLSSSSQRLLTKGLVLAGSGMKNGSYQEEFWKFVLQMTRDSFYHIVNAEGFTTHGFCSTKKEELSQLLDGMIGMAQGTRVDICEHIFAFMHPLLVDAVKLLEVYHNYEEMVLLILELFSEVVQHHLCYLGEASSKKLCEVSLSVIQMYSKFNLGKKCRTKEDEEDTRFSNISIVMELLMNLLAKDFIDFGPVDEAGMPQNGGQLEAAEVVLYGLEIVVPLMSSELLKFPSLCLQYFKLITFLAEIHPEKFCQLAPGLFQDIVASIKLGLTSFGPDITKLCMESLGCLAAYVFQEGSLSQQMQQVLAHFLEIVFHLLLLESFDMSLMDTASTAFFCLICCNQDVYRHLVNKLLEQEHLASCQQQLLEAFMALTPANLPLAITRNSKVMFRQNFDHFLSKVRGFLCVR